MKIKRWGVIPHLPMGRFGKHWLTSVLGFNSPPTHHLHLKYLQQKATHLLGGFLRSLGGRRGSDFCEKLTFRENFSQKNFFKKFSIFPENRLTTARKCGIIKKMN
jgi:hypothetical protein